MEEHEFTLVMTNSQREQVAIRNDKKDERCRSKAMKSTKNLFPSFFIPPLFYTHLDFSLSWPDTNLSLSPACTNYFCKPPILLLQALSFSCHQLWCPFLNLTLTAPPPNLTLPNARISIKGSSGQL